MRPIWSGTISFGLVNIPIGVYSATATEKVGFNLLHKKDHGRIGYKKVCKACDEELSNDEIVKGFEFEKGEYVELTDEDLEKVQVETTKNIEIEDFVDEDSIDPMYFDQPYYLVPGKGKNADQTYVLLREALKKTKKVGIGKLAIRQREYLAAIKPQGAALMLDTMHFADEIRTPKDLNIPDEDSKVDARQLKVAEQLVESLTGEFAPDKYHDTYREGLLEMIDKKLKGVETKPAGKRKGATNVVDIFEKLNESLKQAKTRKREKPRAAAASRKKKAA